MQKKYWEFLALAIIMIIASFFRLYHITSVPGGLYPDEAMDGNSATQALATGHYQVFYTEDNGREGLYANLVAYAIKIFGPLKPWVVRLPAAITGILTVLGIYFLGRELFSNEVGLVSSFLLAISFWHINFSRIGFRAILAPLFLTWAFFFLIRAFKKSNVHAGLHYAGLAGILYGLGFYTYISYRITPLLLLLFIPYFWKQKGFVKVAAVFLIATFLVALPLGWYFVQHPGDFFGRTSEISVFNGRSIGQTIVTNALQTIGMFNVRGDGNPRHNYAAQPELAFGVGIFFIIGLLMGIAGLITTRRRPHDTYNYGEDNLQKLTRSSSLSFSASFEFLLMFLWLLLAALPVILSNDGIPHALRAILMIPPVMIFCALGAIWTALFFKEYLGKWLVVALSAALMLYLIFQTYQTYFVLWANDPQTAAAFNADYVAIGDQINALPQNDQKYVVVEAGGVPVPIMMPNGSTKPIPTPAMTVMYVTNTYTAEGQSAKNVHYLLLTEAAQIPSNAPHVFVIQ